MLTWHDGERFTVGETAFQAMVPGKVEHREPARDGEFLVFKPRPLVEYYARLLADLAPRRIVELGVRAGGSTALFAELARPERLVAIDREPLDEVRDRVEGHAAAARVVGGVDQADRARLAQIVEEQFGDAPLDLVVDDCSHLYEPTRASFNELFPRLRPGGVFVIEDWRWAHPPLDSPNPDLVLYPGQVPLTRLLFEVVLALPSVPGLIDGVSIDTYVGTIVRGDAQVDPASFEISACSTPRGQALLADA